jgi:DeoR family ulaG and ulaABCDEF operon transcriptional repressor
VQLLEQYGINVVTVPPDPVAPDLCSPHFDPAYDLQSAALFHTETSH